jgi:hypothetical protein
MFIKNASMMLLCTNDDLVKLQKLQNRALVEERESSTCW